MEKDIYGYDETKKMLDGNHNEHEGIRNFKIVSFDEKLEVKTKEISKEKKSKALVSVLAAAAITMGLAAGTVGFVDLANHPEDYFTTHPDFDGAPTISEVLERTPENFNIGGR